ncbi:MAG: branched-chain amino acid ABC transporter permease, partial [Solimonas sp.]
MFSVPVLSQIVLNGLSLSAIYILVALGFTLIFGTMKIINFAHGEFAMLGGFALFYVYGVFGLPFLVALPLAALSVAAVSLVVEQLVYQRFYQKEMQGMIATLGLALALTYGAVILWGTHQRSIPPAFSEIYSIGPVIVTADRLVVFGVAIVTLLL